ncbi:MAG: antitoxin MazE family protein [Gammaproteobacteria bacterium]
MQNNISQRVNKHRAALRAAGLRPLQIWVPDTRKPGFAEECRRQSRMLQQDRHEQETLDWLSRVADTQDWQ